MGAMMAVNVTSDPAWGLGTSDLDATLCGALASCLQALRPAHPVSLLDLSPTERPGQYLARNLRSLTRRIRIISYEWREPKQRQNLAGGPDVLIEKGKLPGLPFSPASFDYIVGVGVLATLLGESRIRALQEMRRTALRSVLLVDHGAKLSESSIRDALIQAGHAQYDLTHTHQTLLLSF